MYHTTLCTNMVHDFACCGWCYVMSHATLLYQKLNLKYLTDWLPAGQECMLQLGWDGQEKNCLKILRPMFNIEDGHLSQFNSIWLFHSGRDSSICTAILNITRAFLHKALDDYISSQQYNLTGSKTEKVFWMCFSL